MEAWNGQNSSKESAMNSKTIRVALIGVGGVCAQVHYPGLSRIPGVEIVGICDRDASLREKRSREWRVEACFGDVNDLLREIQPDAVVIATPNCTHKSLILKAFAFIFQNPCCWYLESKNS